MLEEIRLQNFKCFENQEFQFRNLTVLTGQNGAGKSTLLQSILLLRQTAEHSRNCILEDVSLNEDYILLDSAQDILFELAQNAQVAISLKENGWEKNFCFVCDDPESSCIPLVDSVDFRDSDVLKGRFVYLSATRIVPRPYYRIANKGDLDRHKFGTDGEFTLHYFKVHGEDRIMENMALRKLEVDSTLRLQVQEWMDYISPGVIPVVKLDLLARRAELSYEFKRGDVRSKSIKCINDGYGITYALPIVIALLSSKKGDTVLIENPEAHLHPKGQRYLGDLMARAAAGGVQVIVETHSDHVLNGIRVAAHDGKIQADDVAIRFFTSDDNGYTVTPLELHQNGRINKWPEGFFGEWEKAMLDIL